MEIDVKLFLCYYQLHIEDKTFYIHKVIAAEDAEQAAFKMEGDRGNGWHLQSKGVLGEFNLKNFEQVKMLAEVGDGVNGLQGLIST